MKKFLCLLFFLWAVSSNAQQLYLEGGKTISSFDYHDSRGMRLDNLHSTVWSYMGVGFRLDTLVKYLGISMELNYNNYGALGNDNSYNNYLVWQLSYTGIKLGVDYEFLHLKKSAFYVKGTASAELLIQGTQTINKVVYDLVGEDDFNKKGYFFMLGGGFRHSLTNTTSLYIQYMGGQNTTLKNGPSDLEKLQISAHNLGFGLLINIAK